MTWEEMRKKHEDELKVFNDKRASAISIFNQNPYVSPTDKSKHEDHWINQEKLLVDRHFSEASQILKNEQELKAYAKQIQQIISSGKENAEWLDQQTKEVEQKKDEDYERLKKEVEDEVKKEQAKKKSLDRER